MYVCETDIFSTCLSNCRFIVIINKLINLNYTTSNNNNNNYNINNNNNRTEIKKENNVTYFKRVNLRNKRK